MRPVRLVLVGVGLAVMLAILAMALRPVSDPPLLSLRGVLLEVRIGSLVHAEQVTLRADDGRVVALRVDLEVAVNRDEPQSASHLRQHIAFGEPLAGPRP